MAKREIDSDVLERMILFIHDMARDEGPFNAVSPFLQRVRNLAQIVPSPTDPDMLQARILEAEACREDGDEESALMAMRGELDSHPGLRAVLKGIKNGRALESARLGKTTVDA